MTVFQKENWALSPPPLRMVRKLNFTPEFFCHRNVGTGCSISTPKQSKENRFQRSTETQEKRVRKKNTDLNQRKAHCSSPHRPPSPSPPAASHSLLPSLSKRKTATSNIITTTKQGERLFKLEKHNPWPQNPRIQECTTRSTYYNSLAMKARQRNITVQKKPKKKRAINPGLSTKQLWKDPTYKQFDNTRFEAKVQNYAQNTSFRSKLKLLVHLRAY